MIVYKMMDYSILLSSVATYIHRLVYYDKQPPTKREGFNHGMYHINFPKSNLLECRSDISVLIGLCSFHIHMDFSILRSSLSLTCLIRYRPMIKFYFLLRSWYLFL